MRKIVAITIIALVVLLAVVNAAAYAYRWLQGTVNVKAPNEATGAAAVGWFTSKTAGSLFPNIGTNYQATTYGSNAITISFDNPVWTDGTNTLYEGAYVTIPITQGAWYLQNILGLGNKGGTSVYVWITVETPITKAVEAKLYLVDQSGSRVATVDLKSTGFASTTPITLSGGYAYRVDLYLNYTNVPGSGVSETFRIGVYVSQSTETPSPVR